MLIIVIFEANHTIPLTPGMFIDLLDAVTEVVGVPIPVVPTRLLSSNYQLLTYGVAVKAIAKFAEIHHIKFNYIHGAAQSKILDLVPNTNIWLEWTNILPLAYKGWWLLWGTNWLVIDKPDIDKFFEANPTARIPYEQALREDTYRSLISIENSTTKREANENN